MSADPILIVDDELLRKLPEPFRSDPRFRKGASLELIPVHAENSAWKELGGMGATVPSDPNAVLEQERLRELKDEARWRDA